MKVKILIALAVVIVVFLYLFYSSANDPSEVKAVLTRVLDAGKGKDLDGVMDNFSLKYKDEYGLSYPLLKGMMKGEFDKYDLFEGEISNLRVVFHKNEQGEKTAIANFDVYVQGMKSGIPIALIGTHDSPDKITVTLIKGVIGGWKIVSVSGVDERGMY